MNRWYRVWKNSEKARRWLSPSEVIELLHDGYRVEAE